MKIELTNEQKNAIDHPGHMVLTACPGSGKTAVIIERIINDLSSCNDYQGVIAISYTNKASDELKKRCGKYLSNIKSSFFGTMDKFYLTEIIYKYISHLWGKVETINTIKLDALSIDWQKYLSEYCDMKSICADIGNYDFSKMQNLYLKGFIVLEFVPLLAYYILIKSLACNRCFSSKYISLYVDEYQDAGYVQHAIFLYLSSLSIRSTAVGDVDQAIYSYAGRSSEYLIELTGKGSGFEPFKLTLNHRSHSSIVNYASRLIDKGCPLLKSEGNFVERICINGNQSQIASWIDSQIEGIKVRFKIKKESEIAILLATNGSVSMISNLVKTKSRAYLDDSLSKISGDTSALIKYLMMYRYNNNATAQGIIDGTKNKILSKLEMKSLRRSIGNVRTVEYENLIPAIRAVIKELTGCEIYSNHIDAINEIIASKMMINNYLPVRDDELQIMTLHKSKGLEFDYVFHLDLYDWILPRREFIKGSYDEVFTNYEQCLNLHYVGITRAKKCVVLVNSSERYNFQNELKKARPSQFLSLDGLKGLYTELIYNSN
ncbi:MULTISPECIES: UvrD-helicase domain-containing protein [unclassified Serratia (in: enterobacteria)]|uniref:UvrD-helicase domain-containing protein n=1 Tax=unclassified Serratia (in: enterobacteria) TaxID=2647522 RepID=UPI0018AA283D|nr:MULTISPECIES: ATP-dependent helicase [unclassified Serratia (in: enterobacteria)]